MLLVVAACGFLQSSLAAFSQLVSVSALCVHKFINIYADIHT